MCDCTALVTERLYGQSDVRGSGKSGQRVRVSLPPQPAGEEAPLEELPTRHSQAIKSASGADDRVHPRCFRLDADDAQSMAEITREGHQEAIDENETCRRGPDRDPDCSSERVTYERATRHDLMRERE